MKAVAIIPARSGSKGLKDKNIKPFLGKPLLWYSVNAARESGIFDKVVVSTDSEEYAVIARKCSADVPFLRSAEFAGDNASSWDVVKEVIDYYHGDFDCAMLLQPTSPLRTAEDIINAFAVMKEKNAQAVVSVTEADYPPVWCNVLPKNGSLDGFIPEEYDLPRQKLPKYYRYNGAIYLVKNTVFDKLSDGAWAGTFAYVMPKERSVDIDDALDFIIAEEIMKMHE